MNLPTCFISVKEIRLQKPFTVKSWAFEAFEDAMQNAILFRCIELRADIISYRVGKTQKIREFKENRGKFSDLQIQRER
jgi:hypothetical protein